MVNWLVRDSGPENIRSEGSIRAEEQDEECFGARL